MNNLRMIQTHLDNWEKASPRSRTDLNGPGCLYRNLRIKRSFRGLRRSDGCSWSSLAKRVQPGGYRWPEMTTTGHAA
jgi:hypothetical protein